MNKLKSPINSQHVEKYRFISSFVIDLRSPSSLGQAPFSPAPSSPQKPRRYSETKERVAEKVLAINKRASKLSPNLLAGTSHRLGILSNFYNIIRKIKSEFSHAILRRNKKQFLKASRRVSRQWLKHYQNKLQNFQDILDNNSRAFKKQIIKNLPFNKRRKALEEKLLVYRSLWSFLLILILIALPFKILAYFQLFDLEKLEHKIIASSQSAFSNLLAAGGAAEQLDFQTAGNEFQKAAGNFLAAQDELDKIGDTLLSLASLSSNPKIKMASEGKKFLQAGATASSFGLNLALASNSLFNQAEVNFSLKLDGFISYGRLAALDAKQLEKELARINPNNLPADYRQKFNDLNRQVALVSSNLQSFVDSADKFRNMLGVSEDKRYLLVFQNNAELRASGGFLGSYALVDIRDGKIRNLEIPGGGSYDTEGGMNIRIIAPRPLWLVNTLWYFWDANWWPDWPKTAQNLTWFYEKSGGPTVDGVISFTPSVIEDLLKITGPIDLQAEYGLTIDADNFWETVQMTVEQDNLIAAYPDRAWQLTQNSEPIQSNLPLKQELDKNSGNKPKKIIGDLAVRILEVLPEKINKDSLVQILSLFEKNLSSKQILFYFKDTSLQSEFSQRNWSGEIKATGGDYLAVIHTNIAGQKSDRKMSDNIEQLSEITSDGQIINTVKITRTHTGIKNEPLHGVRNVDWLRVYVPQGSELLSADGFISPDAEYLQAKPEAGWQEHDWLRAENEAASDSASGTLIYEDSGKTVFANWLMVDPGESRTIILKYRLPFNFFTIQEPDTLSQKMAGLLTGASKSTAYSLLVQKQAGAPISHFSSRLILPVGQHIFWSYPEEISQFEGWDIKTDLDSDRFWSILSR